MMTDGPLIVVRIHDVDQAEKEILTLRMAMTTTINDLKREWARRRGESPEGLYFQVVEYKGIRLDESQNLAGLEIPDGATLGLFNWMSYTRRFGLQLDTL